MDTIKKQNIDYITTTYDMIKAHANDYWLTISPPPEDSDPETLKIIYLCKLKQLAKCSRSLLGIFEFANDRMHMHIYFSCKDNVKRFIFVNGIKKEFMARIYKGEPKDGCPYLYKDIDTSMQLLKSHIFTIYDINKAIQHAKAPKDNTTLFNRNTKEKVIDTLEEFL